MSLELQVLDIRSSHLNNSEDEKTSIVEIFGISRLPDGHYESCVLLVEGFQHYVHFPVSATFTEQDVNRLQILLEAHLSERHGPSDGKRVNVRAVRRQLMPLLYYRLEDRYQHFLRVDLSDPSYLPLIQTYLSACRSNALAVFFQEGKLYDDMVYEANVPFIMRFMVDYQLSGGSWLEVARDRHQRASEIVQEHYHTQNVYITEAQAIESRSVSSLITYSCETESFSQVKELASKWSDYAPLITMSIEVGWVRKLRLETTSQSPASSHSKRPLKSSPLKRTASTHTSSLEGEEWLPRSIACYGYFDRHQDTLNCFLFTTVALNQTSLEMSIHGKQVKATVQYFPAESEMVLAFFEFVYTMDVDILLGYDLSKTLERLQKYNSYSFGRRRNGHPYLAARTVRKQQRVRSSSLRAARQTMESDLEEGPSSEAEKLSSWRQRISTPSNRAFSLIDCPGRFWVDLRVLLERELPLRTYGFGEIVKAVLGHETPIFSDAVISALFQDDFGSVNDKELTCPLCMLPGEERSIHDWKVRLAQYWIKNAVLSFEIATASKCVTSSIELSKVTGLNVEDVMYKGQMARFQSQLLLFSKKKGLLIPTSRRDNQQGMREGPLNLMPEVAYYTKDPVAVLDFSSLYPSIIIAHNMCYSTALSSDDAALLEDEMKIAMPAPNNGFVYFVTPKLKRGILPSILTYYINKRREVKRAISQTDDLQMKSILEGQQLALKVCANSVYGALGSPQSYLQFLPIAEATVLKGAEMLSILQLEINRRFYISPQKKLLDRDHDKIDALSTKVNVIYGDTDSVFVRLPDQNIENAIEISQALAKKLTDLFPSPIHLAFQQVMFPSLFLQRKRYAGRAWKSSYVEGTSIDAKGIECRRRDVPAIVVEMMEQTLELLLPRKTNTDEDRITDHEKGIMIEKVKKYLADTVDKIMLNQFNLGKFVVTKGLWMGVETEDYKTKQAHVELVRKIKKREPHRDFDEGERVSFILAKGTGETSALAYEKAESTETAIKSRMLPDYKHYIEHQISKPLTRILQLFLPPSDISAIFTIRKLNEQVSSNPSPSKNKITAYFKPSHKIRFCLGDCRSKVEEPALLCQNCAHLRMDILDRLRKEKDRVLSERIQTHSVCHACQSSNDLVVCTNFDCSIFYDRCKIDMDIQHQEKNAWHAINALEDCT